MSRVLILFAMCLSAMASTLVWNSPNSDTNNCVIVILGSTNGLGNWTQETIVPVTLTNVTVSTNINTYFVSVTSNTVSHVASDFSNIASTKPTPPTNLRLIE